MLKLPHSFNQPKMTIHNTGFEIFYSTVFGDFQDKADVLVCRLHWIMLQNGYKCVSRNEQVSEQISKDYNFEKGVYNMVYVKDGQKHSLKLNLQNGKLSVDKSSKDVIEDINVDYYVSNDYKDFSKAYKNLSELDERLVNLLKNCGYDLSSSNEREANKIQSTQTMSSSHPGFTAKGVSSVSSGEARHSHPGQIGVGASGGGSESGGVDPRDEKIHITSGDSGLDRSQEDYSSLRNPNMPSTRQNPDDFPFNPAVPASNKPRELTDLRNRDVQPGGGNPYPQNQPAPNYPSIGRGDLDPSGMGSPDMFFDPARNMGQGRGFGQNPYSGPSGPFGGPPGRYPPQPQNPNAGIPGPDGRLPPGAIPPGARFDPFGPSNTFPEAKPDHMRPPGSDDMYM